MKALSKPIPSPSRADKYPPPLMMRFLRSNVGSRSRGRSRSSPMFYKVRGKKNAIENNQLEPSSPKVTCIGQVRIRRSKGKTPGGASVNRRRGRWLPMKRSFSCGKVSLRFWDKKRLSGKACCVKVGLFFRSGYCKKVDATEDSFVVSDRKGGKNNNFSVKGADNVERKVSSGSESHGFKGKNDNNNSEKVEELFNSKRVLIDEKTSSACTTSPPKNALLLTRCRSAPYRSSSLAGRFWGSPLTDHIGGGDDNKVDKSNQSETNLEKLQNPIREISVKEPIISQEVSGKQPTENVSVTSGQIWKSGALLHPLLLTRCKSEPARTGSRLVDPEASSFLLRETEVEHVGDTACSDS